MLNEAIKTSITQEALSAQQVSAADKDARQMAVAVTQAQKISDDLIDVRLNYGAATGQGHDVCQVYTENSQLDNAIQSVDVATRQKVLELDNAPGRVASDNMAALEHRQEIHADNFCSPEEVENSQCEAASTVAGADSILLMCYSLPVSLALKFQRLRRRYDKTFLVVQRSLYLKVLPDRYLAKHILQTLIKKQRYLPFQPTHSPILSL